jgi:hypothetical protein
VLQNNMAGCTVFSALDMVDGYYQLLMRESDIPLTAVSTPSGMLWEWLVMPQGLSNAPATFNRLVTQLFRPLRHFAQTYFDDIFVHSHAEDVCMQTSTSASSVPKTSSSWDASLERMAFALIPRISKRSHSGRCLLPNGICASGLASPTTCTSTARTTPSWPGR